MARTGVAQRHEKDREAVARAFLQHVRENGAGGHEVGGMEAFCAACRACAGLEWVRYVETKPKARAAITAVIERLMRLEFPDIEKRKRGTCRSSRIFFRVRLAGEC